MVVMVTVHSNQVVAGGNPVAHWLVPAVQIRGHFTVAVNVPVQMTTAEAKPSIFVVAAVFTSDSSNETIVAALEVYWLVKVVHKMVCPSTVPTMVTNWRLATPKVVDTVFLAVSVLTAPMIQNVALWTTVNKISLPVVDPVDSSRKRRVTL